MTSWHFFNALVIDLRGHGDSATSKLTPNHNTWGKEETCDLLAARAWLKDEKEQNWFGLYGFGMGGWLMKMAFFDNYKKFDALLTDGAVHDIKEEIELLAESVDFNLKQSIVKTVFFWLENLPDEAYDSLPANMANIIPSPYWSFMTRTGLDEGEFPSALIEEGKTGRPIGIIHHELDEFNGYDANHKKYVKDLKKHGFKSDVLMSWTPDSKTLPSLCKKSKIDLSGAEIELRYSGAIALQQPDTYFDKICGFWQLAFDADKNSTEISTLCDTYADGFWVNPPPAPTTPE